MGTILQQANKNTQEGSPEKTEIKNLIEQLGDSRYKTRESASNALRKTSTALPALITAVERSGDLEVRVRAAEIAAIHLEKRIAGGPLKLFAGDGLSARAQICKNLIHVGVAHTHAKAFRQAVDEIKTYTTVMQKVARFDASLQNAGLPRRLEHASFSSLEKWDNKGVVDPKAYFSLGLLLRARYTKAVFENDGQQLKALRGLVTAAEIVRRQTPVVALKPAGNSSNDVSQSTLTQEIGRSIDWSQKIREEIEESTPEPEPLPAEKIAQRLLSLSDWLLNAPTIGVEQKLQSEVREHLKKGLQTKNAELIKRALSKFENFCAHKSSSSASRIPYPFLP